MGDTTVRRPVASHFEKGVDFGVIIHKSPFMADEKDPLVLSNYIFQLLEVNPRVAGFLIQLHSDDADAVLESVTAHAEKGAGTKTTLYVGQEEEEEVEEEVEEVEEVGGGMVGCAILGRGAEPPQFGGLLIWLEPGLSDVTWVHYDAIMCLACLVCLVLPVLHFLRCGLFVL